MLWMIAAFGLIAALVFFDGRDPNFFNAAQFWITQMKEAVTLHPFLAAAVSRLLRLLFLFGSFLSKTSNPVPSELFSSAR